MEFIATYWWVWLIGTFVCFAVTMFNQINRIRRMHRDFDSNSGFDGFTKGLFVFAIGGLGSAVFGILFLIGVVIQIINYAKG